jgi:hypothetical protein
MAIWENGDQSESSKFGVPEFILSASPNYGGFLVSHKDLILGRQCLWIFQIDIGGVFVGRFLLG